MNLYRLAISDDTNSRAPRVRVLAHNLCFRNRLRVPTICPPTRRKSGGEIQFLDHAHLYFSWGGLGFSVPVRVRVASGSLRLLASAHQLNFPAAFAAPPPARGAVSASVQETNDAQAFGSASPRVGVGKWWARKKIPYQLKIRSRKIHRSVGRSTVESTRAEDCPGRGRCGFSTEFFRRLRVLRVEKK
jgi:hypothetical protein